MHSSPLFSNKVDTSQFSSVYVQCTPLQKHAIEITQGRMAQAVTFVCGVWNISSLSLGRDVLTTEGLRFEPRPGRLNYGRTPV